MDATVTFLAAPTELVMDIDPTEAAGLVVRVHGAPAVPDLFHKHTSAHGDVLAAGIKRQRAALSSMSSLQPNIPPGAPLLTQKGVLVTGGQDASVPRLGGVNIDAEGANLGVSGKPSAASAASTAPRMSVVSARSIDRLAMPKSVAPSKPAAPSTSAGAPSAMGRVSLSKTSSILSRPPITAAHRLTTARPPAPPGATSVRDASVLPPGDTAAPAPGIAARSALAAHALAHVR